MPDPIDISLVSKTQQDTATTFNYTVTVERGIVYNVTGFGENVIGNGSVAYETGIVRSTYLGQRINGAHFQQQLVQ